MTYGLAEDSAATLSFKAFVISSGLIFEIKLSKLIKKKFEITASIFPWYTSF